MEYPLLNTDEALARFGGNAMILKTLLKKFPGMANPLMEQLTTQVTSADYESAEHTVHTIKGTAGNLSLTALFHIASDFDAELKRGECKEDTYSKFVSIFDETLSHVNDYIK